MYKDSHTLDYIENWDFKVILWIPCDGYDLFWKVAFSNAFQSSEYFLRTKCIFSRYVCRYFEDDEDVNPDDLEYQPAPGSPTLDQQKPTEDSSDSEEDPLDAFMAGIEVTIHILILGKQQIV